MTLGNKLAFLGVLGLCLLVGSCDPSGSQSSGGAKGVATRGAFIKSENSDLNQWLDEQFEVEYKHMTPQLIFDQIPLNTINYQIVNLPTGAAPFNFSSPAISRRELLQKIASHWKLTMSIATDEAGNPVA